MILAWLDLAPRHLTLFVTSARHGQLPANTKTRGLCSEENRGVREGLRELRLPWDNDTTGPPRAAQASTLLSSQ